MVAQTNQRFSFWTNGPFNHWEEACIFGWKLLQLNKNDMVYGWTVLSLFLATSNDIIITTMINPFHCNRNYPLRSVFRFQLLSIKKSLMCFVTSNCEKVNDRYRHIGRQMVEVVYKLTLLSKMFGNLQLNQFFKYWFLFTFL